MINGLIYVLLFQALGEALAFTLPVPIPGPVIGMVLLFLWLMVRGDKNGALTQFSTLFLRHLSLLFIPAAVGIMLHADRLAEEWVAILVAVFGSVLASITVTAYVVRGIKK